ncbi:MAG: PDDEXK nuclease domain-containing protein [Planctomycetota bacterium]|nr:PDDEXK nuclease domain-containing protein [Planctomycetota bacterium]
MTKPKRKVTAKKQEALFGRVVSILEQARGNVVRAVNTNMVLAYWLIGREIVQELQGGKERAKYGEKVVEDLSARLTGRYGKGFSVTNLWYFKQFYQAFQSRFKILHPLGGESSESAIPHPAGGEFSLASISYPMGTKSDAVQIVHPVGAQSPQGFSPQLSWSHYRALMRVDNLKARDFYEREAVAGAWDKRTLERQIQSFYYERILKSRKPEKMLAEGRSLPVPAASPADELKHPYVLEFLGLPDVAEFHESDLERAIISHLQRFLLELGTGFAFVARQKHVRIEEQDRYIDLVFYHCRLKFYLLIDLKVGELTHADVGQMDGYVRMYDGLFVAPDDNPTIGLILCTEKNETVARYSVLNDRRQIFASKYMLCLPTEEQLRLEVEEERRLIESTLKDRADE